MTFTIAPRLVASSFSRRQPNADSDPTGSSDHRIESAADSAAVILNECCYSPLTVILVFMKVPLPPEYIATGSGAGVGF